MLIGAGKVLEGEDAASLMGHWKDTFINECGAAVIGEVWRAVLEGDATAGNGGGEGLSIIEYARASKGECEDFHSLAWKRPVSKQSHHALCIFEEEVAGGGIQKAPFIGRIKRFVKLSYADSELEDLRAAEVELYRPGKTYDGSPPTASSTLFRVNMQSPEQEVAAGVLAQDRRPEAWDSYMVPLQLIECKLCRCGVDGAATQHYLRYTAYSRTLGGET